MNSVFPKFISSNKRVFQSSNFRDFTVFSDAAWNSSSYLDSENGRIWTDVSQTKYRCNLCSRVFIVYDRFQEHVQSHSEKKFICKNCHKSFRTKDEYVHHRKEKHMFSCMICGKVYTSNYGLKNHKCTTQ